MLLRVQVKSGQHKDRLWRREDGLVAHIRAVPKDGEANAYLVRFLAGELRVAASLVSIHRGRTSGYKTVMVDLPEADVRPQLERLTELPQTSLFDAG